MGLSTIYVSSAIETNLISSLSNLNEDLGKFMMSLCYFFHVFVYALSMFFVSFVYTLHKLYHIYILVPHCNIRDRNGLLKYIYEGLTSHHFS